MNPEKLPAELLEAGAEKARTRAYHTTMDRLRKQVRAAKMQSAINSGSTIGKAEAMALTDPAYIEQCQAVESAEYDMILAQVAYDAIEAEFEAWRTLQATARAEMGIR